MSLGEFFGYLASLLVFMAFYMKTMVPLRIVAISSNVAFLTYAIYDGLIPIMILHALLLPLNVLRLHQISSRIARIRASWKGDVSLDALFPFMTQRSFRRGDTLFRNGDDSRDIYFILDGTVRLVEVGKTVGPGELLGEISMFSPGRRRTATAVCETDGTLLQIGEQKVLELYHQNPSFGFYLVRLITGRLIENQSALMAELEARAPGAGRIDPSRVIGEAPQVSGPSRGQIKQLRLVTSPYVLGAVTVAAGVMIYAGWSLGPYLQSLLFRDAAVTTWVRVATSPIKGNLEGSPLTPGQRVGSSGRIALVRNEQADDSEVHQSTAEVARARAKVDELETYLAWIRNLDAEFQTRTEGYADNFKKMLAIQVDEGRREVAHIDKQLELMRVLADRKVSLAERGDSSQSSADQALVEAEALERLRVERNQMVAHAQQRLSAAEQGVYLTGDGRVPEWAYRSADTVRLEIATATKALADARAELAKARIAADAARDAFDKTSESPILAPPGSLVWSVLAHNGQAVDIGTRIAKWIDCSVILVDVPASDVEIPLLRTGLSADVVVEGDVKPRTGTVLMARGTAATLDDNNLAAIAKGRSAGTGQVIVSLEVTPKDRQDCPVGRAASVDFPQIDTADLVRAWLRF